MLTFVACIISSVSPMVQLGQQQSSLESSCLARCTPGEAARHASTAHDALGPCSQFSGLAQQSAQYATTVSQACSTGVTKGALPGCVEGCRVSSQQLCFDAQQTPAAKEALVGACSALQQVTPRPLVYDACLHGFRAGMSSACSASHHWALTEASQRAADAQEVARRLQAQQLAEVEARLEATRAEEARKARLAEQAAARAREAEVEAKRKAAEEAAALEARRKGKTRGVGRN